MKQAQRESDASWELSHVILTIGPTRLMLPRVQLRTLEPTADVSFAQPPNCGVGWLQFQGVPWPVFSFDEELVPRTNIDALGRVCALFSGHTYAMAILCDEFLGQTEAGWQFQNMKACMPLQDCPIKQLARLHEKVGMVSDCDAIGDYLSARYGTDVKLQILRHALRGETQLVQSVVH